MKKSLFILSLLLVMTGCGRNGMKFSLKSVEQSLIVKSVEAGVNLDSINTVNRKGHNKRYCLAMGWYELGKTYSQMNRDPEAINALLKARELLTDTLSVEYVSALDLLGRHYNNRGLYDDALNTFSASRRLYEKKGDGYMVAFTDYNIGVAYFGKKEYEKSRNIFEKLQGDRRLDAESRNMCYLHLAYIENDLNHMEAADRVLELSNKYLAGCTDESAKAPGYAIKGIALYYLHENDSAFVYLEKAHRLSDDLNTKILAMTGLEWVATQMRHYQAAWNAEITNKEYREQLNRMSNQSEITQIQLQHNDEMQNLKFRTRVTRVIWISISLIIILIAAVIIYIIQRDRRREAYYLKKYDDLIQKQIEEKSNSEGNRLMEACEAFRTGIAFNLVNDVALQKRSFRQEERDVVVHDINLYFANPIAVLRAEAGKLGQQDINLIFCTLLGFDQELVADIMCTSRSNMRSIKSRLKSKISAESFALYFKE